MSSKENIHAAPSGATKIGKAIFHTNLIVRDIEALAEFLPDALWHAKARF